MSHANLSLVYKLAISLVNKNAQGHNREDLMKHVTEGGVLDVVMTGEAARICGVDRRTFLARADREGILPVGMPGGRAIYERKDVEKLAKRIKTEKEERRN